VNGIVNIVNHKNTLILLDTEIEINDVVHQKPNIDLENTLVLQNELVSSPFDDLMRSIILAVYQHNIEEIVVVTNPYINSRNCKWTTSDELPEEFQEKEETLNYIFKNCKQEYLGDDVSEWFLGRKTLNYGIDNTASLISQHPLMPSNIIISEINIQRESEIY